MGRELTLLELIEIEEQGISVEQYLDSQDVPRFANCEIEK